MGRGGGQVVRVLAFFPTILVRGWSLQFFLYIGRVVFN